MNREQLKERARRLPMRPGIYLHKDKTGTVIYVGKAKRLRNRVANYFQPPVRLDSKTRQLVNHIYDFDIIVTENELEALVLENAMIKKYQPKYNILLKDDKNYPFIRVDDRVPYPSFTVVSKLEQDGARYFGPYLSHMQARQAIEAVGEVLQLKTCSRSFPNAIGKGRPCLQFHLKRCCAPCTGNITAEEYQIRVGQAIAVFQGDAKHLARAFQEQMEEAAEALQFERAAALRDKMRALEKLNAQQHVIAGISAELDACAFVQGQTRACVCVLHYADTGLQGKEYALFPMTESNPSESLSAFVKQYYAKRETVPKTILLSHALEEQDAIIEYLSMIAKRKVEISTPQRGDRHRFILLAEKNAREEIERREQQSERRQLSIELLQSITGMKERPVRLEAYDISHLAGQDTVGSMIVFIEGKPHKSSYRKFTITSAANGQDDYASMREMLTRRIRRYQAGDEKFSPLPQAFLIDGGLGHAHICREVLDNFGIDVPCFGMVKDERHRTKALITADGRELGISTIPALFALIGRIQEETHRFAIEFNRKLSGKRMRRSTLDKIPGIGEKRRRELLRRFGNIEQIKNAPLEELTQVLPRSTAQAVFSFFHPAAP